MQKISIDQLRNMWGMQGIWGDWRNMLKDGYHTDEIYFEFGLMPEQNHDCQYRIILDHEVPVWLCPADGTFRGEYVIRPDDEKEGTIESIESTETQGFFYHTLYVKTKKYLEMIDNAMRIYEEYKDDDIVCFWSIPNKWFADLSLVQFLTKNVVSSEYYKNRIHSRHTLYWP